MDKTTLSMRMRDPSEKIHSQIRRPSFSDSLLTVDSKRVLSAAEKHYLGPKRALPRTRRVSDSKMLPPSGQDSFCQSNNFTRAWKREGVAGTHHSVCRGRSVSRLSPGPSLQVFVSASLQLSAVWAKTQRPLRKVQKGRSGAGKPSHSCNLAQYDDIVHIIVGVIFPIPMRKVKGNSGSTTSSAGGRKRVPEGASGPS